MVEVTATNIRNALEAVNQGDDQKRRPAAELLVAMKFGKDTGIGAMSAAVAKTLMAPIERVKLIIQLQNAQVTIKAEKRYHGMLDCLRRLPKEQGFLSFWRGNLSNVLRSACQESLGISFKEFFRKYTVNEADRTLNYKKYVGGSVLAGSLAGAAALCIVYPLDFSQTRLSIDMGKDIGSREFTGLANCFMKIAKHDGVSGLYRGFFASLQCTFLYRGAYYGIFDVSKAFALDHGYGENDNLSFGMAFLVGNVATFFASIHQYPLDTVRRRLMMDSGKDVHAYNGTVDCINRMYRTEGFKSFFSGNTVNIVRGFGSALILALYNETSKYL